MAEMPCRAHSSTMRRISTVLPEPEPAKITVCRRRDSTFTVNGARLSIAYPRPIDGPPAAAFSSGRLSGCASASPPPCACGSVVSAAVAPRSPSTSRNSLVQLACLRATSHSWNWTCGVVVISRSAANTLRSCSEISWTMPPAATNPSVISLVRLPLGHPPLRSTTSLRCGMAGSRPAMVHAALTRLMTATALVLAIARNPQWASFSVASFSTSMSRPCSAGFAGGNGSRLYVLPVGACSSIHAARPAASSAGICASSVFGSSAAPTSTEATNSANRSSSGLRSTSVPPLGETFRSVDSSLGRGSASMRRSSSMISPRSRHHLTWLSTRRIKARGVRFGASLNASGLIGQVG